MKSPAALLKQSEERVNNALRDYEAPPSSTLAREFYELRVQAAIFNYDIAFDITSIWQAEPEGFAEKVALKNLVHRLFEYDQLMQKHLIRRLLELAKDREIEVNPVFLKASKRKWKEQFKRLEGWSAVRNKTSGHYGHNLQEQVSLLKSLKRAEVMDVVQAFLSYNVSVLNILKNAGRGSADA
jgi:truncated hemoglobin YjbI